VESKRGGIRRDEVLGNYRRQTEESRIQFGMGVSRRYSGRIIWIVDARRDGKRFMMRAEEKLSAFVELEREVLTVTFYLESIRADS